MNAARQAGHWSPGTRQGERDGDAYWTRMQQLGLAVSVASRSWQTPGVTGGRFTEFPNRPLSTRRTEKRAARDGEKGEGKEGEEGEGKEGDGDDGDEGEMRVRS